MTAGPLHALFAEASAVPPAPAEIDWYARHLPFADGLVLDVLCGIGRVLVPLAAAGHKLHGVDPSAACLERCNARLAAAGAAATTFRQDVVQLNLPFRYAGAYVADGALQAIADPAAAQAALARVGAHLVPPAVLVVDCRVPPAGHQRLAAPLVELRTARLPDGSQIALRSETAWTAETFAERAQHRYAHRRGAERLAEEQETVRATWYTPDAMRALLRAAGFAQVRCVDSPAALPAGESFAAIAAG